VKQLPREIVKHFDDLTSREALFFLFHYSENQARLENDIIHELKVIGSPLKDESIEGERKKMCREGIMVYEEVQKEEQKGGSNPRVYKLSHRGLIEAEETVNGLLEKFRPATTQ